MTQDVGYGIDNYFSKTLEKTIEVEDDTFVQKYFDEDTEEYSLYMRKGGRYNTPEPVSTSISNEEDLEQLLLEVKQRGLENLLEPRTGDASGR